MQKDYIEKRYSEE